MALLQPQLLLLALQVGLRQLVLCEGQVAAVRLPWAVLMV